MNGEIFHSLKREKKIPGISACIKDKIGVKAGKRLYKCKKSAFLPSKTS